MPNKFVGAFKFLTQGSKKSKVAPTVTQPRQLKTTMKKIRSQYKRFGFKDAKTAKDRANIVRTKKSIERMDKLNTAKAKRKEGIKASKEIKKMIGTGQADRVGGSVYHRHVRDKKALGGITRKRRKKSPGSPGPKAGRPQSPGRQRRMGQGSKKKELSADAKGRIAVMDAAQETVKGGGMRADRFKEGLNVKGSKKQVMDFYARGDTDTGRLGKKRYEELKRTYKAMGGVTRAINKLRGKEKEDEKRKEDSIKEKILPKKKKERLEQLKKELGMKKGGKAKFPDLTGDGKVTRADILKGRGVFRKGGASK